MKKGVSGDAFKKYDNYDAIEVPKQALIPWDYGGLMGLPITFLDRLAPPFELIDGLAPIIDGKRKYFRLIVRNTKPMTEAEIIEAVLRNAPKDCENLTILR